MVRQEIEIAQSIEQATATFIGYVDHVVVQDKDLSDEEKKGLYGFARACIRGFTSTLCEQINENTGMELDIKGIYDKEITMRINEGHLNTEKQAVDEEIAEDEQ